MRVIYTLKPGFVFRRANHNKQAWHIRDERDKNGPGLLPFCNKRGIYSHQTEVVQKVRQMCQICRKEAEEAQVLVREEV